MPPICRAHANNAGDAPPPRQLLDSFLNNSADALARIWTRGLAPPPSVGGSLPVGDWLQALFADTPKVAGAPAPLSRLQASHRAWLRSLHMAGDRNVRVAFRLEAPQPFVQPPVREWPGDTARPARRYEYPQPRFNGARRLINKTKAPSKTKAPGKTAANSKQRPAKARQASKQGGGQQKREGQRAGQQAGKQNSGQQKSGQQNGGKQNNGRPNGDSQQAGGQQAGGQQAGGQQAGGQQASRRQRPQQQNNKQQNNQQQNPKQPGRQAVQARPPARWQAPRRRPAAGQPAQRQTSQRQPAQWSPAAGSWDLAVALPAPGA